MLNLIVTMTIVCRIVDKSKRKQKAKRVLKITIKTKPYLRGVLSPNATI
jgi:hypothetical protein